MRGGEILLAKRINEYLKENGIKQTWLAEKVGVPITTFNGIINGRVAMKADMFIKICVALGEPPERFTREGK